MNTPQKLNAAELHALAPYGAHVAFSDGIKEIKHAISGEH